MLGDLQRERTVEATTRLGVDKEGERVSDAVLDIFEHALGQLREDAKPAPTMLFEHLRIPVVLPPAEVVPLRS